MIVHRVRRVWPVGAGLALLVCLLALAGAGPPHRLFVRATVSGSYDRSHYCSDDGGRTWQCMTPPEVRTRAYLPLLRIRS